MNDRGIKAHFLLDCIVYKYQALLLPAVFFLMVPLFSLLTSMPVYFEYLIFLLILPRFMLDFQNKPEAYLGSLPISRRHIVFARYMWVFFMLVLGTALLFLSGTLFSALLPGVFESWLFIRSPWSLPYVFILNSVPLLIAMPVYYGIGAGTGLIVGYLGVVFYLPGMPLLISVLERFNGELRRVLIIAESKTAIFGYAVFLLEKTGEKVGPLTLTALILFPFIGLALASLCISAGLYNRKEVLFREVG
jgi:hypothetical protein